MLLDIIADNVARIRQRIALAAARSGRTAEQVTLVAVTKYVAADLVRPLVAAGCFELGESRPQQLWEKAAALADLSICWHSDRPPPAEQDSPHLAADDVDPLDRQRPAIGGDRRRST